jgi:hypothetical protein
MIDGHLQTASSMLKLDVGTQIWGEVAPLPEGKSYAGVCVLVRGVYDFGGKG